jgi:uncharacterized protein
MLYLVDGHNLIGSSRSIRLTDEDDEAKLLSLLHRWVLRNPRHRVVVVFDNGVHGHPSPRHEGIEVVWTHSPQDADARLKQLMARGDAAQTRLVTSDRGVIAVARDRGIEIRSSASFMAELEAPARASRRAEARKKQRPEPKLSRAEVDSWLAEFGGDS